MRSILCLVLAVALLFSSVGALGSEDPVIAQINVLNEEDIPVTPWGIRHYLLICMDSWQANLKRLGYTDGMVLLSMDESTGRIMVTSFIRDMLVIHPDGNPGRLTYIAKQFGIQGLVDTINRHFGIRIEKYIMMDWSQVQAIVDAAGGVKLDVTNEEASYLRRYAISPASTTPSMQRAGTYLFKGHAAVIFMRMRKVPASNGDAQDFGRTFRARTVLSNIADSLRNVSYEAAQDLLSAVLDNTLSTNLTPSDILEAFNVAFSLRGTKIEQCRLPFDDTVRPFEYANGAAQLMDFEKNRALFHDFLFRQSYVVSDVTP